MLGVVLGVVPFDNRVLDLADSLNIAENFLRSILFGAFEAFDIIQNVHFWFSVSYDLGWEPLNAVHVHRALQVVQIDGNFDYVAHAYLYERPNVGSLKNLL